MHILPNISRSKSSKPMAFGWLILYNKRIIILQKSWRKYSRETSSDLFLFFQKALNEIKAISLQLNFKIFWQPSEGFGNRFSATFCKWSFKKYVPHVIFYYLNKLNFIVLTCWDIDVLQLFTSQVVVWRYQFWN